MGIEPTSFLRQRNRDPIASRAVAILGGVEPLTSKFRKLAADSVSRTIGLMRGVEPLSRFHRPTCYPELHQHNATTYHRVVPVFIAEPVNIGLGGGTRTRNSLTPDQNVYQLTYT